MTAPRANRLLIDAEEFKAEVEARINSAKDRVYVQAMTFEMDGAGKWLLEFLRKSNAKEKILSIDAYSLFNINDGWVFGKRYWTTPDYKKEVDETRHFLKSGGLEGIQVHITNRLGWRFHQFPARNHKKLLIVDEVAYVGGLNFSEHNFAWHDLMAIIDNPALVDDLSGDFKCTLKGINQSGKRVFDGEQLYYLDGRNSADVYEVLFEEIYQAKRSIQIISPYVSDPLLAKLIGLEPEVKIQIITPSDNNKSIMKHYLMDKTRELPWEIYQYQPGMSHAKAILIDGEKLIIGSSNFDFVSYHLEQEVVWISSDKELIEEFKERVWQEDLQNSTSDFVRNKKHNAARIIIFVLSGLMRFLGTLQARR